MSGYLNWDHKKERHLDMFEFSWKVHGFNLFSKFLPITTKLISNQMNFALNMTRRSFADKPDKVDTSDFRNAIVYYL